MSPSTLAIALLIAVVVWGSIVRHLTAIPWAAATDGNQDIGPLQQPAAKVGFYALLAVITSFFLLFISAYLMRRDAGHGGGGWHAVGEPPILWLNTLVLMGASIAMQWARKATVTADATSLIRRLYLVGALTLLFLVGQGIAWTQLSMAMPVISNPASAFVVLLTALHGLHLVGGLVVWTRTQMNLHGNASPGELALRMELCAKYWHYLLVVWLVLFSLLLAT